MDSLHLSLSKQPQCTIVSYVPCAQCHAILADAAILASIGLISTSYCKQCYARKCNAVPMSPSLNMFAPMPTSNVTMSNLLGGNLPTS